MLKFFPMGGIGYIGGNISYIELNGTGFIVDTGILFPREESLGINYLYPDLSVLDSKDFLKPDYLLLTHAHEDHIGGIKHLIQKFPKIKIVCSEYTKLFIEKKFPDFDQTLINCNDFKFEGLSFFNLRHSIPGVYGFHYFSEQENYSLLFCTDFRFDGEEKDNTYLNSEMLKSFSKKCERKLLFVDSTNICSKSTSCVFEKDIYSNLEKDIADKKRNIYITMFPSNTKRLGSIIKVANKLNLPVNLCGFSVKFGYELGLQANLIERIKNQDHSGARSISILSGSQGDLRGAFRRVFTGNDKSIKPKEGDYLMYSSKVIPGNEKSVGEMFNKASLLGLEINKGTKPIIHASGHAYPKEITNLVNDFQPTDIFPIHLESSFFQEFDQLSKKESFPGKVHRLENYKGITFAKNKFNNFEKEQVDLKLYLHGGESVEKGVINDRRRLGNNGTLFISLKKEDLSSLRIDSYGIPNFDLTDFEKNLLKLIKSEWNNNNCEEALRVGVRHYLSKRVGYKPLVFVHLI